MPKPELILMLPIYAPVVAELEREFTVHKLRTASDPEAFMREISGRVRGAGTSGLVGFDRSRVDEILEWFPHRIPHRTSISRPTRRETGGRALGRHAVTDRHGLRIDNDAGV